VIVRDPNTTSNPRLYLAESANHQAFPPAFQADVLSLILGKSVAAILADRSRAPHRLPPACSPPGTRRPTWLLADVLEWLAKHRETPVTAPALNPARPRVVIHRKGRPTKVEQTEAKDLGITVRELRARYVERGQQ
jgi:hypothetical protein